MSQLKEKLKAKVGDAKVGNWTEFESVIAAVHDDPDFFVDQGGTAQSHAKYMEQYGKYEPEISEYAKHVIHGDE